ncbi:IS1182 family transposase [Pseudomonas sp. P1B16]|jgi:transposase/IS5 family transposase|uniref:Transposase n=34 Tax=cellular organisms TaxID=131567 RepID=A0A2I0T0X1_LIMLA|nr:MULTISPECIES: IS1182 family transposase [Pseudomonadota]EGJ5328471.1 IS1182 family transposase [Escherichia coli]KUJ92121.1 MAG: tnp35 [Pseudomonas sp. 63_8]MBC4803188.1 IS1182 family transposase [Klebsiella pneumoniae]MBU1363037.1 IS1182 family transposase [Gammaproteobacteria bacterium]MDU2270224.1 IS1182 family transposase [Winkia neuii]MDU7790557.1 IS1182 family transposase [Corynebacterium sp.]PKU27451.1 transposase [Limosa lapponica baueri]QDI32701.1 IS1182 family transposase [Serr|tara:strand:+ start:57 stop:1430 length:1374 start_codon:yes stop_codon:yes gene_type:complete
MSRFRPINREIDYLLPPSVQDWLPESHLARYVVEVVEGLDLSKLESVYAGRGSAAYHPAMLLSLLIYGYATGAYSSRKIERASYDSLAFRFIACDQHPDHDTLASFRRRHGEQFAATFVQVLQIARENQVSRFGTVSLDGTKIHANASRHSALSYAHAEKIEAQLKAEVQEMLKLAEAADQSDLPDGVSLPDEIKRREDRLAAIAEAKTKIEARAKERLEREQAEYQAKLDKREAKEKANGKKPGGKPPKPPQVGPRPDDQINLTDEESRIMKVAGGGFEQCYNAQALVDSESMLVMAPHVTQAGNDKEQVVPMLAKLQALPEELNQPEKFLADSGYFSEKNVEACEAARIEPLIAVGRDAHHRHWRERFEEPAASSEPTSPVDKMKHRLKTKAGRAAYGQRKQTVEPVFGIIKSVMGFRQFLLRGLANVQNEWTLVCLAWNLKRMATLRPHSVQNA